MYSMSDYACPTASWRSSETYLSSSVSSEPETEILSLQAWLHCRDRPQLDRYENCDEVDLQDGLVFEHLGDLVLRKEVIVSKTVAKNWDRCMDAPQMSD